MVDRQTFSHDQTGIDGNQRSDAGDLAERTKTAGDETYLSDVLRWFSSIFRLQMLALFSIII